MQLLHERDSILMIAAATVAWVLLLMTQPDALPCTAHRVAAMQSQAGSNPRLRRVNFVAGLWGTELGVSMPFPAPCRA